MNNIKTCADFTDDHCAKHPQCHGCPAHIDELKKCGDCIRYEECSPYTTPDETFPEVGGCPAHRKPTNYDRIRNMSVEEMAAFLLDVGYDNEYDEWVTTNKEYFGYYQEQKALSEEIKWLESEVTE